MFVNDQLSISIHIPSFCYVIEFSFMFFNNDHAQLFFSKLLSSEMDEFEIDLFFIFIFYFYSQKIYPFIFFSLAIVLYPEFCSSTMISSLYLFLFRLLFGRGAMNFPSSTFISGTLLCNFLSIHLNYTN